MAYRQRRHLAKPQQPDPGRIRLPDPNATAINNNGQIVANAIDTAAYQTHAPLLTPQPTIPLKVLGNREHTEMVDLRTVGESGIW